MRINNLIEEVIKYIESEHDLSSQQNGTDFENYVVEMLKKINTDKGYDFIIEQTGKQTFPDIIINNTYGIEVKFSKGTKWESTGNSIFEGTLKAGLENQIFLLFGKQHGDQIQVRYKNYEDVLSDIKVTHSPRFYINMDVNKNQTILSKLDMEYNEFRVLDPPEKSKKIKEFVRRNLNEGEALWWIDESESSPKVQLFSSLSSSKKDELLSKCMVLFPEIFSSLPDKYARATSYLLREHQIMTSSLRDNFSAGGKFLWTRGEFTFNLSQIYRRLSYLAPLIHHQLSSFDLETLNDSWQLEDFPPEENTEGIWKYLIDNAINNNLSYRHQRIRSKDSHKPPLPSEVYEKSLSNY
ncbi:hypothetical protein C6Y45_16645 [Alkalicoccus saliphilus]|uniref:Restriction endonuclease n=2 Tax=Alkalicoccus saliphilus TaxID=200989 RepID=A0A2T4U1X8_9BACI|nr:hypothetical protein C6Y45_16645 [Alkalicoccus saliphilus]